MPRRIENTIVPRNPVAQAATKRLAGAHARSRSAERQQTRDQVRSLTDDWRNDLQFERELRVDSNKG